MMNLITNDNVFLLWQDVIKLAEERCLVRLEHPLEAYLVNMLARYTSCPDLATQHFALPFLAAQQASHPASPSLQFLGDQCLLYVGLFPKFAEKRLVKVSYFVQLGQVAYSSVSVGAHDVFYTLAKQFVVLMDILQSIRNTPDLLPLEAYEQWNDTGSQRAYRILQSYTLK